MSKQTAVEWLGEQLKKQGFLYDLDIEKGLAMEREQHEDTWLDSRVELQGYGLINKTKYFEEYYEETYGKEASHEG